MRARLWLLAAALLLAGCSVLFNGDRHRGGGGEMDGGADGGTDGSDGGDGIVCTDHLDCPVSPFLPICGQANADGVRFCQDACADEQDCVDHPSGEVCVAPDQLCGCTTNTDCPDPSVPFCLPAPDSFCVPCLATSDCGPGQVCEDNLCVSPCTGTGPSDCDLGEVCARDRCVADTCDGDQDGFVADRPECPELLPFDCNDSDPMVFPGALPDCARPGREACPGGPLDMLFGATVSDVGVQARRVTPASGVQAVGGDDYQLDVVVEGDPARAASIAYAQPMDTFARVRVDDRGGVIGEPALPGGLAGWTIVRSFAMAREGSGTIVTGAIGETGAGVKTAALFDASGAVSGMSTIAGNLIPGIAVSAGPTVGDAAVIYRQTNGGSDVIALSATGGPRSVRIVDHGAAPWLAAASGVAIGSSSNATFVLPLSVSAVATVSMGAGDRGAIARADDTSAYFFLVPTSSGLVWGSARSSCASSLADCTPPTQAFLGMSPALPAMAPGLGGEALVVVRERTADPFLRLTRLREGSPAPPVMPGGPVLERLGPSAQILDVAVDSLLANRQLDVAVAAIVLRGSTRELHAIRVRACLP